jgi:hypothetical protein
VTGGVVVEGEGGWEFGGGSGRAILEVDGRQNSDG